MWQSVDRRQPCMSGQRSLHLPRTWWRGTPNSENQTDTMPNIQYATYIPPFFSLRLHICNTWNSKIISSNIHPCLFHHEQDTGKNYHKKAAKASGQKAVWHGEGKGKKSKRDKKARRRGERGEGGNQTAFSSSCVQTPRLISKRREATSSLKKSNNVREEAILVPIFPISSISMFVRMRMGRYVNIF